MPYKILLAPEAVEDLGRLDPTRVGRVFYDVVEGRERRVEVLAIVPKGEAAEWLEREGLKS